MKRTLKISELSEGHMYYCNLSDRKILITSIIKKDVELPNKSIINHTECRGLAYSNGIYETIIIWDNMLSHLTINFKEL